MRLGFAAATLAAITACSGSEASHGDAEHSHEGEGHAHEAQFGGTLVELGDHFANLEFTWDAETGEVALYTWDAHVTGSERSSTEAPSLTIAPHVHEGEGVEPFALVLAPRVSETTRETVGDSSKFTGQHDSLKGLDHFTVTVAEVTLKGKTFKDVEFMHPSDAHDHDHDGEEGHEEGDGHDHDGDEGHGEEDGHEHDDDEGHEHDSKNG